MEQVLSVRLDANRLASCLDGIIDILQAMTCDRTDDRFTFADPALLDQLPESRQSGDAGWLAENTGELAEQAHGLQDLIITDRGHETA